MKIGNIVYREDLVNHEEVEYINYIPEAKTLDDIDNTLPTLYVGWKNLKECNPHNELIQNHSILEKRIFSNVLYWEYSFNENKSQHVSGVEMFVNNVPYHYFSTKYRYTNIDPVFFGISGLSDLTYLVADQLDSVYIYKNEMLYFLNGRNISGIDLVMYNYFDFDVDKIVELITSRSTKNILDNESDIFQNYYKQFPNFDQLKRYLVVLLSKE